MAQRMRWTGKSVVLEEDQSEDVSCSPEIQSKVPVPPPPHGMKKGDHKGPVIPPEKLKQLAGLRSELLKEEKTLLADFRRRKERALEEHERTEGDSLPWTPSVEYVSVVSGILDDLDRNREKQKEVNPVFFEAMEALSAEVGRKKRTKLRRGSGKSLLEEPVLSCGSLIQSEVPGPPSPPPLQQQRQPSVYDCHEIYPEGAHEDEATTMEAHFKNLDLSGTKLDDGEKVEARTQQPEVISSRPDIQSKVPPRRSKKGKSFVEKQLIGPLPRETEMQSQLPSRGPDTEMQSRGSKKGNRGGHKKGNRGGHKKGKHGGCAAAPPARPQHHSAMDLKQVQGSNESKLCPCDHDMKMEMDRGKSALEIAKEEEMAFEAKTFASYRRSLESNWGACGCAFFEDTTTVSPMHFTHCTPGCDPGDAAIAGATLQIFTIKLEELKGGLEWPLSVYGVVAARDSVDHSRNLLFSCDRWRSQKLSQDDPFLRLIGPSRAIVFTDDVYFETELRVKGKTLSQDIALISGRRHYSGGRTISFSNCFCRIELCMERIHETVQATILGVRVKNGPWPFDYGGKVACLSPPRTYKVTDGKVFYTTHAPSMEVVMLASCGRTMPKGSYGYLRLSRHEVSVELEGSLNVVIQAYSESGDITAQGEVCFTPKACNISQETCFLGDSDPKVEVEITVAWSLLASNRRHLMMNGMDFDELKEAVSGMGV